MKPKWHWSNKPEKEKKEILKKISKGWFGGPNNKFKIGVKNRVRCKCLICGKEFEVKESRFFRGRGKYCSLKCWGSRQVLLERKCLYCGKKFLVSEVRAEDGRGVYCCKACQIKGMVRENSTNWQGGLSLQGYSVGWTATLRRSIRERDHYTCQLCGKLQSDKALSVHHIDYDKENCDPKNLISLCNSCNIKVNSNRDYWTNYFRDKLKKYVNL